MILESKNNDMMKMLTFENCNKYYEGKFNKFQTKR